MYTPPFLSGSCQRAQKHFSHQVTNVRMKRILEGWLGTITARGKRVGQRSLGRLSVALFRANIIEKRRNASKHFRRKRELGRSSN
jgi:hypothetical protein